MGTKTLMTLTFLILISFMAYQRDVKLIREGARPAGISIVPVDARKNPENKFETYKSLEHRVTCETGCHDAPAQGCLQDCFPLITTPQSPEVTF